MVLCIRAEIFCTSVSLRVYMCPYFTNRIVQLVLFYTFIFFFLLIRLRCLNISSHVNLSHSF